MALSDMYEVVHEMILQGKSVISVYHVERTSGIEVAATISDGFQTSILPTLRLQQNVALLNSLVRIFNLETTTDFGTFSLLLAPGLRVGDRSPTFIAAEVRYPSLDRDIRSGHKRYAGMQENDYTNGVMTVPALALVDANADATIGTWVSSIDAHVICRYVIIKRICKTVDPVSGDCLVYRLPLDDTELKFYQPTSRLTNIEISSQVSRKVF